MKTLKWLTSTVGLTVLLAGCGGGGDDAGNGGGASGAAPASSVGSATSNNEVQRHFASGDLVLWGYSFVLNGVTQVFIGKQTVDASGRLASEKIAGQVTSPETPPSLFDLATEDLVYRSGDTTQMNRRCEPKIAFEGTDHAVVSCTDGGLAHVGWTMRLKREDVSGKFAKDYVRNASGAAVAATWANAASTFASGATAVTASFEARADMFVSSGALPLFFRDPVGSGWCQTVPGQGSRLGVLLNTDKTTSLFDVPGTSCSFAGLTPIATGSWTATASGVGNVYTLVNPASVATAAKWQPLFSGAKTPSSRLGTLIQPCSGGWCVAQEVKKGETFESSQPHFNDLALPALKSVAGL